MSDLPVELDLKFLPDWLKEAPSKNRYADFEGESPDRRRDDFGRGRPGGARPQGRGPGGPGGPRPGGPRPGGPGGPRPAGPGGPRPSGPGGPRPGGPGGGQRFDQRRGPGGPGGPGGPRPGGPGGGPRRDDRRDDRGPRQEHRDYDRPPQENRQPVVRVDLVPEPAAGAGISKQIKTSARACGVFRVAKMFLDRPERYRVRIAALDPNATLYQVGSGPVSFDRGDVERGAYRALRDDYYVTETTQGEAPKGNYTTVARDRFSGALLGPSNHHGYQAALRKLYDERYARRLEWQAFLYNIENVNDPAAIEQWKLQASSVTVIKTKAAEGEEPVLFKTEYDAEQHFRTTHLPKLIKSGRALEVAGPMAGVMLDRNVAFAVRDAVERERRVPLGIVNGLRPYFSEAGLHLFKWKRKILFASAIRPQRHPADTTFSDGMAAILTVVGEQPGIKRPQIANKLLVGMAHDSPEALAKKEALASDLHYLIHIGYVVEFQNGCLELPPGKKEAHQEHHAEEHKLDVAAEMEDLREQNREAAKPAEAAEAAEPARESTSEPAGEAASAPTEAPAPEAAAEIAEAAPESHDLAAEPIEPAAPSEPTAPIPPADPVPEPAPETPAAPSDSAESPAPSAGSGYQVLLVALAAILLS